MGTQSTWGYPQQSAQQSQNTILILTPKTTAKMNAFFVLTLLLATATVVYSAAAGAAPSNYKCPETIKEEIRYKLADSQNDHPACIGYYYCKKGMEKKYVRKANCPTGTQFQPKDSTCTSKEKVTCKKST